MKQINKKLSLIIAISYLVIQIPSYILSVFYKVNNVNLYYYSFIVINLILGCIILFLNINKDNLITTVGLLFTLIADTFLVLLNHKLNYINQIIAMFSFNLVQIMYYIKLINYRNELKIRVIDYLRFSLILLIIIICNVVIV